LADDGTRQAAFVVSTAVPIITIIVFDAQFNKEQLGTMEL